MKKGKKIIGIIVVLIVAFLYAHIAKANIIYDNDMDISKYVATGVIDGTVEQQFVCVEDTLDGITTKCLVSGDVTGVSVVMTLIDCESEQVVASAEIAGNDIENSKFNTFEFDTLEGTKDRTYKVCFENKGEDSELQQGVGFAYLPEKAEGTQLVVGDKEAEGTLIMKTITNRFDVETFCVFLILVLYIVGFIKFLYKLFSK